MTAPGSGDGDPRHVGLAVASTRPPGWVGALARRLEDCPGVTLDVFVYEAGDAALPPRPAGRVAAALWRWFRALDARLQRVLCPASPRPDAVVDLVATRSGVSRQVPGGLSLVVDATGRRAARTLAEATGAPVWWLDHDGGVPWPDVASGYVETLRGEPAAGCRLLESTPGGADPRILASGSFSVHPLVAAETRQQLLWKSIPLVVRELMRRGPAAPSPAGEVPRPEPASPVEGGRLALLLAGHAARAARFVGRRLTHREQWCLAVADEAGPGEATSPWRAVAGGVSARLIQPPPDRYWADPHPLPDSGGTLILVEEYPYSTHQGRIAMLRLDEAGTVLESRTVLETGRHLSYPSLFEVEGEVYMAPESSEDESLTAYRCTAFPWRWEPAATLLADVRALDATLVRHDDRWWLFATVQEEPWLTPRDTLHVFSAHDPFSGDWTPHPLNPVVCDPARARPAGPLFSREGRLYRPAQDCGPRYGYGVRIQEVVALTTTEYEERHVASLEPPGDGFVGTHTFVAADGKVVVDRLRWLRGRRSPRAWRRRP